MSKRRSELHPEWKLRKFEMRRRLRRAMTPAERVLLAALRERPERWKAQRLALGYVLDFFCQKAGLCVELDGDGHATPKQAKWDARRTVALEYYGVKVLRFPNERVFSDLPGVVALIVAALDGRVEVDVPRFAGYSRPPKVKPTIVRALSSDMRPRLSAKAVC